VRISFQYIYYRICKGLEMASKLLANTLKNILMDPAEGFTVELGDDSNLFEWKVYIEGPKDTFYEGGVFQLTMKFPDEYPMLPPELKFISDFWHPNVYKETGVVCISILHPPGDDEMSGEIAAERWMPTQTVTTILLSVISLLNAPNTSSPANVDASVEWRKDPELFKKKCLRLVDKANKERPTHVVIPHPDTNQVEREKHIAKLKEMNKPIEEDDFMQEDNVPDESEDSGSEVNSQQEDSEEEKQPESKDEKKSKSKKINSTKNKSKPTKTAFKRSVSNSKSKKSSKEEAEEQTSDETEKKQKKKKCTIM